MKKLLFLLFLLFPTLAVCGEPLLLINPGRETFLNFPSASVGNDKTVTVFLPEPAVPLRGRYPVIYLLGAGPDDAQAAQEKLDGSTRFLFMSAAFLPMSMKRDGRMNFTVYSRMGY